MARREYQDPSILERETPRGIEFYIRYRRKVLKMTEGKAYIDRPEHWHTLGLKKEGANARNPEAITLRQAERLKSEVMRKINGQAYTIQSHIPWDDFLELYEAQRLPSLAVPTQRTYRQWIRLYIRPAFSGKKLCDIKPIDVECFLGGLRLAQTTRASIKGILASIYRCAEEWGYWQERRPIPHRLKGRGPMYVRQKRIPTPAEIKTILGAVRPDVGLIIETLVWTGMRASECFGLQPPAFDLDRGLVWVTQRQCRGDLAAPKSERGRRALPLGYLVDRYRERLASMPPGHFVFTDGQDRPYKDCELLANYLTPILIDLGLKWPGFGWHTFRRLLATWMNEHGASLPEIMDQLGHTRAQTTLLYVVGDVRRRAEIVERMQAGFRADKNCAGTDGKPEEVKVCKG